MLRPALVLDHAQRIPVVPREYLPLEAVELLPVLVVLLLPPGGLRSLRR